MHALDSFISPIPGFDGDIPILAISVLARPSGDKPTSDPSTRASASKTRVSKQKATANPIPQKKAKKATGRSSSVIKINDSAPKAPASTPPSGPRQMIPIHHSKRYTRHECHTPVQKKHNRSLYTCAQDV
jgi:hypothetical protein